MRRVVTPPGADEVEEAALEDPQSGGAPTPGERTLFAPPPPAPPKREETKLQTEFDFVLPKGFVDANGEVHRHGTMRLATARDELLPLHDDRVRENPQYLSVVLLARVITRLGTLSDEDVNARVVENMFASDLAFLQDLYRRINSEGHTRATVTCPACKEQFAVDLTGGRLGES
jgi:hypothetical protein